MPMVGRTAELESVMKGLEAQRLCVIEGGPGEGKTLLAERAGLRRYYQGLYPAGAYRVDVRGACGRLCWWWPSHSMCCAPNSVPPVCAQLASPQLSC